MSFYKVWEMNLFWKPRDWNVRSVPQQPTSANQNQPQLRFMFAASYLLRPCLRGNVFIQILNFIRSYVGPCFMLWAACLPTYPSWFLAYRYITILGHDSCISLSGIHSLIHPLIRFWHGPEEKIHPSCASIHPVLQKCFELCCKYMYAACQPHKGNIFAGANFPGCLQLQQLLRPSV